MMKPFLYSVCAFMVFGLLFWGSTPNKTFTETLNTYEPISRPQSAQHQVDYLVPSVTPATGAEMDITYKGVEIRCEVIPIEVTTKQEIQRIPVVVEASQYPKFDVFQIKKIPTYSTSRSNVVFKITLTNRQDRVLKLVDAPIVMLIDGDQYQLSEEVYVDWNNAMVIKGFTKEFSLIGPDFERLVDANKIYLSINDVPVEYDRAGNVLEKKNFEWNFDCAVTRVQKTITIPLTYETKPSRRESCGVCSGRGSLTVACSVCGGDGKAGENNSTSCFSCGGDGKKAKDCSSCDKRGFHYRPESRSQRVAESERWLGWEVEVESTPSRLQVYGYQPQQGSYSAFPRLSGSGENYRYWSVSNEGILYPLQVRHEGQKYAVYPFLGSDLAQKSYKVEVDFTQSPPALKGGFWGLSPEEIPHEKEVLDRTPVPQSEWENEILGSWVYTSSNGNPMIATYKPDGTVTIYMNGIEWVAGSWEVDNESIRYNLQSKVGGEDRESIVSVSEFKKDVLIVVDGITGRRITLHRGEY